MNLCSVSQFCWYIDAIIVHVIKSNFVGTSRHASANPNKLPSTALAVQCGLRNSGSYGKGGEGLGGVAWRVPEPGLCFLNLTAGCCVASQLGSGGGGGIRSQGGPWIISLTAHSSQVASGLGPTDLPATQMVGNEAAVIKCSNTHPRPATCAQNPLASHCPPPPPYTLVVRDGMLAGQGWKAGCVAVINLERSPSPPPPAPLEKGGVFLH